MLPISATMGLGSPLTVGDGSRAGTPTKSDIPAITVTASPAPLSGAGAGSANTPTSHAPMQMSMPGRSQCF
ncbi:hypothetical protein KR044_001120 [Drosophila immigrans]|nr:hypothetical protein KR044_001120 [Drosophila immigrans]